MTLLLGLVLAVSQWGTTHHEELLIEEKKCSTKPTIMEHSEQLFIFSSFSMPIETWKSYSQSLEKTGGTFVLRGIPEESFQELSRKVQFLRENGVVASICIDPEAFEKQEIKVVPTILVKAPDHQDKIVGNIPLEVALEKFVDKGDTKPLAKQLLEALRMP